MITITTTLPTELAYNNNKFDYTNRNNHNTYAYNNRAYSCRENIGLNLNTQQFMLSNNNRYSDDAVRLAQSDTHSKRIPDVERISPSLIKRKSTTNNCTSPSASNPGSPIAQNVSINRLLNSTTNTPINSYQINNTSLVSSSNNSPIKKRPKKTYILLTRETLHIIIQK